MPTFESLEARMLLCNEVSGAISQNTEWDDTSQPYCIVGMVTVESGVTLQIQQGVDVNTPSLFDQFRIDGTVEADGVQFTGDTNITVRDGGRLDLLSGTTVAGNRVFYESGSLGSVAGSEFTSAQLRLFSSGVTVQDNTFSGTEPVHANPSLVPKLYDSTFTVPATILVSGAANQDAQWQVIPNVQRYHLGQFVTVAPGVTLGIGPGVEVSTEPLFSWVDIDGTVQANGVQFTGDTSIQVRNGGRLDLLNGTTVSGKRVSYERGSLGTVADSEFTSAQLRLFSSGVTVQDNTFSGTEPVHANPSFVPKLYNSTFTVPATILVSGAANQDAQWQVIPNVQRYHLGQFVTVAPGVTLGIGPGVEVSSEPLFGWVDIDGTVQANGVQFTGDTSIQVRNGGRLDLLNGTTVAGKRVSYESGSLGTVAGSEFTSAQLRLFSSAVTVQENTFAGTEPVHANPSLVPKLYDSTFAVPATILVSGTANQDAEWEVIPNVSHYHVRQFVTVTPGVTLGIGPGVEVSSEPLFGWVDIDGTVQANGVQFTGDTSIQVRDGGRLDLLSGTTVAGNRVQFGSGSLGTSSHSEYSLSLSIHSDSKAVFVNNDFSFGTVVAAGSAEAVIDLRDNYWGTQVAAEIEAKLTHRTNDPNRPLVLYEPWLTEPPSPDDDPPDDDPPDDDPPDDLPNHAFFEIVSKDYVYSDPSVGDEVLGNDCTVDEVFSSATTGFFAIGVACGGTAPLIAFRGTELTDIRDLIADSDPRGVGFSQFEGSRNEVRAWLDAQREVGEAVTFTGYSLGGALAQWFAADYTSLGHAIAEVVTFNAPGISRQYADMFRPELADNVTHYITSGDLVSMAGEAFLDGRYVLSSFSTLNLLNKHRLPVVADSIGDRQKPDDLSATTHDSVEWLNHPFFIYYDRDYFVWVAAAQIATLTVPALNEYASVPPALLFRSTTEQLRKKLGTELDEIAAQMDVLAVDPATVEITVPNVDMKLLGLLDVQMQDMYLRYEESPTERLFIQGRVSLPGVYNVTADFAGQNYIQISHTGLDVVGEISAEDIVIVPNVWEVREASIFLDTVDREVRGGGSLLIPTGTILVGELGFMDGQFNALRLGADNLNKLFIPKPPIFLQRIEGWVDHIAQADPLPPLFGGALGATGGPQVTVTLPSWAGGDFSASLVRLDVEGQFDRRQLEVSGELRLINGLATAEADVLVNWEDGYLHATGEFEILAGLISAAGQFRTDTDFNVTMFGEAAIAVPDEMPVIGGRTGLSGNFVLDYTNDQDLSNDSVAAWTRVRIFGELGYRVWFDGRWEWIGGDEIEQLQVGAEGEEGPAQLGHYEIAPGLPAVLFSTQWEQAAPQASLRLQTPTGQWLTEEDLAAHPNMEMVEQFSDQTQRVVAIENPEPGIWTLAVDGAPADKLAFVALGGTTPPELEFTRVSDGLWGGPVEIELETLNADPNARVSLYYTPTDDAFDGILIASDITLDNTRGQFFWDPAEVPHGDYFIYAMIDDAPNAPVFVRHGEPATIAEPVVELLGPEMGFRGQELDFSVLVEHEGPFTYSFDWTGDGQVDAVVEGPGQATVTHTFDQPGEFTVTVVPSDDSGGVGPPVSMDVMIQIAWQNSANPFDVIGNGLITPLDALLVINHLNRQGIGPLPIPPDPDNGPPPYLDVTGNDRVDPLDALQVINELNRMVAENGNGISGGAEGEALAVGVAPLHATSDSNEVGDPSGTASMPLEWSITPPVQTQFGARHTGILAEGERERQGGLPGMANWQGAALALREIASSATTTPLLDSRGASAAAGPWDAAGRLPTAAPDAVWDTGELESTLDDIVEDIGQRWKPGSWDDHDLGELDVEDDVLFQTRANAKKSETNFT